VHSKKPNKIPKVKKTKLVEAMQALLDVTEDAETRKVLAEALAKEKEKRK
jgi:hypothetical protein